MNEFNSRGGYKIQEYYNGNLHIGYRHGVRRVLTAAEADGLREFFQAQRDKELGRWRWPEDPSYVVYLIKTARGDVVGVEVLDEKTGESVQYPRGYTGHSRFPESLAAAAYFDAHPEPEPEPWHDAKPGEVWEITHEDGRSREMTCVMDGINLSFFNSSRLHTVHYTGIRNARRIWPEEEE